MSSEFIIFQLCFSFFFPVFIIVTVIVILAVRFSQGNNFNLTVRNPYLKPYQTNDVEQNIRRGWHNYAILHQRMNRQKRNCPNCGADNDYTNNFCSYCGATFQQNPLENDPPNR